MLIGQEADYGFGYHTIIKDNPAFSGSEGNAVLRLSFMNHYPGKNFNLQSFFLSYDSFISGLHGGIGAYLSNDYLGGIINDLRGGFSYSYHLQADRDIFINAGLGASFFHRGLNLQNIILPDQIDPVSGIAVPSAEIVDINGRTVFDVATGIMLFVGRYFGGLSISHLAQPDLTGSGSDTERLKRKYLASIAGNYSLGKNKELIITPVISWELQDGRIVGGAGGALTLSIVSVNAFMVTGSGGDLNLRTGFSLMKGTTGIFYNYNFNISSKNKLLPFSLMHQAGLSISLYNVDKRKTIKTIKFPNL
jgi:type IX secretion system PorP/SprF family membrane protein